MDEARPRIGVSGRSRAMRTAVAPLLVKAAMALAPMVSATWRAALAMASALVCSASGRSAALVVRQPSSSSTRRTMRAMMVTASIGYWPAAVSADSITASAPSKMAVATSVASARVGVGALIMLSSICVATMTGLPQRCAVLMIRFCASGTSSGGSSTPRSPRATITASESDTISSS